MFQVHIDQFLVERLVSWPTLKCNGIQPEHGFLELLMQRRGIDASIPLRPVDMLKTKQRRSEWIGIP